MQIFKYILVGSFNSLFCYSIFVVFTYGGLSTTSSMTAGYLVTVIVSYFLMAKLVFKASYTKKGVAAYLIMQTVGYFINISILQVLMSYGIASYVSGVISLSLTAGVTFVISKFFIFTQISRFN